jgi:hypothetical protein
LIIGKRAAVTDRNAENSPPPDFSSQFYPSLDLHALDAII